MTKEEFIRLAREPEAAWVDTLFEIEEIQICNLPDLDYFQNDCYLYSLM